MTWPADGSCKKTKPANNYHNKHVKVKKAYTRSFIWIEFRMFLKIYNHGSKSNSEGLNVDLSHPDEFLMHFGTYHPAQYCKTRILLRNYSRCLIILVIRIAHYDLMLTCQYSTISHKHNLVNLSIWTILARWFMNWSLQYIYIHFITYKFTNILTYRYTCIILVLDYFKVLIKHLKVMQFPNQDTVKYLNFDFPKC